RGPRCVLSCATHPLSIRSFPTRRSSDLSTHDRRGETFATNLEGTENVLTAARKVGVERVVLASSCNIYGRATCTDIDETTSPDPINPYAETKAAAEESLDEFTAETDATGTALRLSTVYGDAPGIRFNLVVN